MTAPPSLGSPRPIVRGVYPGVSRGASRRVVITTATNVWKSGVAPRVDDKRVRRARASEDGFLSCLRTAVWIDGGHPGFHHTRRLPVGLRAR